mgnify:CR=1 FL=1
MFPNLHCVNFIFVPIIVFFTKSISKTDFIIRYIVRLI